MKKYLPSPTLKAIVELRKLVYFLAENIDLHSLWGARAQAGIEHLELKGDSNKQTIVNLLIDCQKHFSLDKFIESLVTTGIVGHGFIDLSIFQAVNYEFPPIENISFEIPRESCCRIEDSCDGSIEHRPLLQTKPHKKYKCHYIKYCAVCGETLATEVSHKWEAWHYEREKSCSQKRVCSECDEVETRVRHDWTKWSSNSNGSSFRICNHCNKEEFNIDGKWHGFVFWDNGKKDYWELKIETSGFLWDTTKAEIKVYVSVTDDNRCEYVITQKAKVCVENDRVVIKGKKVISSSNKRLKYNPDNFEGKVNHGCQYIEGTVCDGTLKGTLKLSF